MCIRDRLKLKVKTLPKSFLAWVDSDPEIAAGVYAAHDKPEDVLLWLYSLRLDLGKKRFEKYRQLALAAALVSAKEGMESDIKPRKPLKLVIPGDPRKGGEYVQEHFPDLIPSLTMSNSNLTSYGEQVTPQGLKKLLEHVFETNFSKQANEGKVGTPICIWGTHGIGKTQIADFEVPFLQMLMRLIWLWFRMPREMDLAVFSDDFAAIVDHDCCIEMMHRATLSDQLFCITEMESNAQFLCHLK